MTPEQFRELKFGMFIHYNMATYVNEQWVKGYPSPATFNPGGTVDTDAWAEAAVSAGMTYVVLTAKHVSGFCLWDSKLTSYNVMHPECPYQQDLFAQFVESFTRRGLKVGAYYCWRNPGFDDKNPGIHKVVPPECDPATHSLSEQIEFQQAQIRELIQMFPEICYVWNDGLDPRVMPREDAQAFAASLGPSVICSANWWDWGRKGEPFVDIAVKEGRHFAEDKVELGETCWKVDGWFWDEEASTRSYDEVRTAMDTALSKGSNFLLNVGPDRKGRIIPDSLKVLAALGRGAAR